MNPDQKTSTEPIPCDSFQPEDHGDASDNDAPNALTDRAGPLLVTAAGTPGVDSADFPGLSVAEDDPLPEPYEVFPIEAAAHLDGRAARLRHRDGPASTVVAGAGAIAAGAGVASAAPASTRLTARPIPAGADGTGTGTDDSSDGTSYATGDRSGSSDPSSSDANGSDGRSTGSTTDSSISSSSADGSGTAATEQAPVGGPGHQGWDGFVYWFQNSSGVWRYTAHYDIYLNRISACGADGGISCSASSSGSSSGPGAASSVRPSHEVRAVTASTGAVETAVQFALAQLGKPSATGGTGPNAYDCFGLIQQSFLRAGVSMPRIADDQYGATTPIATSQLRRGDLLFWSYDSSASGIHHGAIYLGGNQYIEAAHPGANVRISTLSHGNWPTHISRP